jgi:bifunctional non-homologous end joining protein LigD
MGAHDSYYGAKTQREIKYFVCDDEESLLYFANMGSIPIHIWASRASSLELPDWCVIDLDPKEAPFSDVILVPGCFTGGAMRWVCRIL